MGCRALPFAVVFAVVLVSCSLAWWLQEMAGWLLALLSGVLTLGWLSQWLRVNTSAARLAESEHQRQLLQAVIDQVPDLIYCKDQGGNYLGCNAAFAAHVGVEQQQLLQRCDSDLSRKRCRPCFNNSSRSCFVSK
ncbi:MAG: PAS domain-containing protein [Motiliproteus sp.]